MKELDEEIWREIPGTNGYYLVSSFGRAMCRRRLVNRGKYTFWSKEKILSLILAGPGKGYPSFMVNLNGSSKRILVHRVVADFWCPNPENKPQVNHRDGNKLNNHYSNLEWCTAKENINHAFNTGLNRKVQQNEPARSKPVIKVDKNGNEISKYPSISEAARQHSAAPSNINHAIKHKKISHGHFWKYE